MLAYKDTINLMNYKKLFIALAAPQLAGLLGSMVTITAIDSWYTTLNKPFFSPPNWIFGPVWTVLYLLMGISIYLIWNKAKKQVEKNAVTLFWVHLFFNMTWSWVFFGLQNPLMGLINILLILLFIIILIYKFWQIDWRASVLLFPYAAWVTFATMLNFSLWQLN